MNALGNGKTIPIIDIFKINILNFNLKQILRVDSLKNVKRKTILNVNKKRQNIFDYTDMTLFFLTFLKN